MAASEKTRQAAVAPVLEACIRNGRIDLFMEWHQFWQPQLKDDLWSVTTQAAKGGLALYAKRCSPERTNHLEQRLAEVAASGKPRFYESFNPRTTEPGVWYLRANELDVGPSEIAFANVAGPVRLNWPAGGHYLALGSVTVNRLWGSFIICEGEIGNGTSSSGRPLGVQTAYSFVAARGTYFGTNICSETVLLVDGDIDLTQASRIESCLIRATGEIWLPKNVKPENCTIEANVKNATAPYKFFELADVGVSLADDEEGLVVTAVKGGTPFGDCGLAKGDLIRAIDDVPAGHSEAFRKKVRRALVRQGDCLLTVTRGDKTIDLPVFFPLPK